LRDSLKNNFCLKISRCYLLAATLFLIEGLVAQQPYFQQEVNYKIKVSLNDKVNTLHAFSEIQYINNSSTSISYIYFHLWPNAYKNNSTALAKQLLNHGNASLYYSKEADRGYIDSLDFKVNGLPVKMEYDKEHIDICKIYLNEPLRSLDTLIITTPFFVKIPSARFSRMGHMAQAYYMTQWYPKPAVFDKEGWHPMPYLDQGEFYSEFGSFEVSITLPKNYVVASTGDLEDNDEEIDFINSKVVNTLRKIETNTYDERDMVIPHSSPEKKTVTYRQHRVHDFAWFADKRFNVLHDQIELPNTHKTVDTWVYFTNSRFGLWKDAIDYVNESTLFYSYLLGDYPYNNVSAVDGVLMAGGGMEYPNITVIGDIDDAFSLDMVITHEVGHNWFYGILGSNERDFPFMDEGLNSLYEMRYNRAKYPGVKLGQMMGLDSARKILGINKIPYWREHEITYFMSAKANYDQPIYTKANEFTSFNYGAIVYGKAAIVFDYLREYMGEETFDKAMQFYYEKFKFKHPSPADLLQTLQYFSGSDLNWVEEYLLNDTKKIDYKIKNVKGDKENGYTVKVKNKTGVPVPISLCGYKDKRLVGQVWFKGSDTTRKLYFPPADVDYFKIDGSDLMPDINRKNNGMKAHGVFRKCKPWQFNLGTKFPDDNKTQINYLPIGGYNVYNSGMAGLALHNYSLYDKKMDVLLAPMYAFGTNNLNGFADVSYNLFPRKFFREVSMGTRVKKFNYDEVNLNSFSSETNYKSLSFFKLAPYINFDFSKRDKNAEIRQSLHLQSHIIWQEKMSYNTSSANYFSFIHTTKTAIHDINYFIENHRIIHPWFLNANVQSDGKMGKASVQFKHKITVARRKNVEVRLFAGTFFMGSDQDKGPYRFRLSGFTGAQDYLFDANYVGRNADYNSVGGNQFVEADGAFKVWTPLGQSNTYLISMNIKSPTIWKLPVKAFFDVGTAGSNSLLTERLLMDAGLCLSVIDNIWEVYVPLVYSNDIKQTLSINNYSFIHTIRFTFNLHYVEPKNVIKDNLF